MKKSKYLIDFENLEPGDLLYQDTTLFAGRIMFLGFYNGKVHILVFFNMKIWKLTPMMIELHEKSKPFQKISILEFFKD